MVVDILEVKDHLGVTYHDSDSRIMRLIEVAERWLRGAIGEYDDDDERAKQLALFVIEDLYDRDSYSVKESRAIERLRTDFLMQLQCEARTE
ncbi:MAG: head-tail connector protein [Peptococcaceae bacterium]|nr:head-tail connector protein [Peptococcaceae bacterium]